jgi:hypothetical protein
VSNAADIRSTCVQCQLQSFASDDGPPHRGQREQSGEDAAQDRQRLAEEEALGEALSGTDQAGTTAATSPADARLQPGDAPSSVMQAADGASADPEADADVSLVEAELAKLGFEAEDGDQGLEAMDADGLTSLSGAWCLSPRRWSCTCAGFLQVPSCFQGVRSPH